MNEDEWGLLNELTDSPKREDVSMKRPEFWNWTDYETTSFFNYLARPVQATTWNVQVFNSFNPLLKRSQLKTQLKAQLKNSSKTFDLVFVVEANSLSGALVTLHTLIRVAWQFNLLKFRSNCLFYRPFENRQMREFMICIKHSAAPILAPRRMRGERRGIEANKRMWHLVECWYVVQARA